MLVFSECLLLHIHSKAAQFIINVFLEINGITCFGFSSHPSLSPPVSFGVSFPLLPMPLSEGPPWVSGPLLIGLPLGGS